MKLRSLCLLALFAGCSADSPAAPDGAPPEDIDAPAADVDVDAAATIDSAAADGIGKITAPADQWTWVDFATSKCASGTPTGLGVDPHTGSTDLVIYFEGGGACTNAISCWGADPGAANLAGYDATTFASAPQRGYPILQRALAGNPFHAANYAYVPYCTGDFHAGTRETDLTVNGAPKPTYFWGGNDLDLFLARLVPTFTGVKHIWIIGTSAGGFGTTLVFDKVARAFGVRVDIIDDSGPAIVAKGATDNSATFTAWGYVPPTGCSPCTKLSDVLAFDRREQPTSKYAFLSYAQDTVISKDFGYTLDEYPAVISAFTATLKTDPNAASLVVTNAQSHVVQTDPILAPTYLPWMTLMVNDDPAWKSLVYAHP